MPSALMTRTVGMPPHVITGGVEVIPGATTDEYGLHCVPGSARHGVGRHVPAVARATSRKSGSSSCS